MLKYPAFSAKIGLLFYLCSKGKMQILGLRDKCVLHANTVTLMVYFILSFLSFYDLTRMLIAPHYCQLENELGT